ncbi:HAD family hydrolase [Phaeobacter marinintestinus]|uniref:HAD family hydrolase n=1 Tax=Falsiphaeobacter marinintestinus TaxID=1492905 RepID=UPI0011B84E55|nr:HAD family hydrolase [Phaeobacter marinintestinus]
MKLIAPLAATIAFAASALLADPLPSWNDTDAKSRIIDFVESVTDPASDDYVTPANRIATFDNDGTLWAEQPIYFQLIFAIDVIADMAREDPSILTSDPLKAAAAKDYKAVISGGKEAVIEVLTASHAGMSVTDFQARVAEWVSTATHPQTGLRYDQMTYQPMVELLRYLRDEDFKTYIVSGGGIHFMRVFAEQAYGIPSEQVIGTYTETQYTVENGVPMIIKAPAIGFVDDKDGKPVNIERIIGKRPILAAGNSDGDFAMLEWSTAGDGPRLGLIVHHTDADREYAYDRDSHIGKLVDGLDKGPEMGWLIIDMAQDWHRIYTGVR